MLLIKGCGLWCRKYRRSVWCASLFSGSPHPIECQQHCACPVSLLPHIHRISGLTLGLGCWCRPLVLLTPKYLHHHRPATSALEDMTSGTFFNRVIDDGKVPPPDDGPVTPVLCAQSVLQYKCSTRLRCWCGGARQASDNTRHRASHP